VKQVHEQSRCDPLAFPETEDHRLLLLAGDSVLIAVEAPVVGRCRPVEPVTAPECRHRRTAGLVSSARSPHAVREPLVEAGAVLIWPAKALALDGPATARGSAGERQHSYCNKRHERNTFPHVMSSLKWGEEESSPSTPEPVRKSEIALRPPHEN